MSGMFLTCYHPVRTLSCLLAYDSPHYFKKPIRLELSLQLSFRYFRRKKSSKVINEVVHGLIVWIMYENTRKNRTISPFFCRGSDGHYVRFFELCVIHRSHKLEK